MFFSSGIGPSGRDRAAHSHSHRPVSKQRRRLRAGAARASRSPLRLHHVGHRRRDLRPGPDVPAAQQPAGQPHRLPRLRRPHHRQRAPAPPGTTSPAPPGTFRQRRRASPTTEQQVIQKIWARVAEDFAPFNVDVTTQDPGVEALRQERHRRRPLGHPRRHHPGRHARTRLGRRRLHRLVQLQQRHPGLRLQHQREERRRGRHATRSATPSASATTAPRRWGTTAATAAAPPPGARSWGRRYSPNVTQWSKGEYAGANNPRTTSPSSPRRTASPTAPTTSATARPPPSPLLPQGASRVGPVYGVVERNTDADYFSFYANAGADLAHRQPAAARAEPRRPGPAVRRGREPADDA